MLQMALPELEHQGFVGREAVHLFEPLRQPLHQSSMQGLCCSPPEFQSDQREDDKMDGSNMNLLMGFNGTSWGHRA
jgi:hypothetical protein